MNIETDQGTVPMPDGTAVIYIDKSGDKVLGVYRVEGGVLKDMLQEAPTPNDPSKEVYSEIELRIAAVPASSGAPRLQAETTVRLCRNRFGNVVPCPPR